MFHVPINKGVDLELHDQLRSWYDMIAFKQVHTRSAADARAEKIRDDTTPQQVPIPIWHVLGVGRKYFFTE